MARRAGVTLVGAGASAVATGRALRQAGFTAPIVMVGDERHLPYDRPPLSKQVLQRSWTPDRGRLLNEAEAQRLGIEVRTGVTATGLDVAERTVHCADGGRLAAEAVVIATGVRPRPHPTIALRDGVHVLRTAPEAMALATRLKPGIRVAVIGAGFLGLEIAASAATLGCGVRVLDLASAVLGGRVPGQVAARVQHLHEDKGVIFHLASSVEEAAPAPAGGTRLRLADGTRLDADLVVVAIGTVPNTEWLADSGLDITNGVACDPNQQAAPGVYAIGDVANVDDPSEGRRARHEHRSNASESGLRAACSILGQAAPPRTAPSFWTDQYNVKLQLVGRYDPDCELQVTEGDLAADRFLALLRRGEDVVGAVGWNMPRQLAAVGREIGGGTADTEPKTRT